MVVFTLGKRGDLFIMAFPAFMLIGKLGIFVVFCSGVLVAVTVSTANIFLGMS